MNGNGSELPGPLLGPQAERVDEVADRFEVAWRAVQKPRIEDFLGQASRLERSVVLRELLALDLHWRRKHGERPDPRDYHRRFPADPALVRATFDEAAAQAPRSAEPRTLSPPTHVGTGSNLLFGILALQNNFIGRDDFLCAFTSWVGDKSRSIGQILLDRGALTPELREIVATLVQAHLKANDGEPDRSLAALGTSERVRRDLERMNDPDLSACLSQASAARTKDHSEDQTLSVIGTSASARVRYRVLRAHAQGGLGVVFVASDDELHREVALKQIKPDRVDDEESRKRFLLEAEVTGRLEHPGIVPVYSLGTDSEGKPFYTMRFVKGERLKDAIERYHNLDSSNGGSPKERFLTLRNLLNRFVAVCNAVAYAHSRGILHRDLKPSNVMLGPFGETLLVDWGMAKVAGRQEPESASSEATLRPSASSGSSETQPGSAIGTPTYMSPEQAEGRLDQLGPATDVYGLGATLFSLLTGRPPFEEKDVPATLEKVRSGQFPRPHEINRSVPPALEAVCVKAMSLRPEDRYASARELTGEIERWLADEPVSAHREPITSRMARWGRRNRVKVVTAMTLLLASVVALSAGIVLIEGQRERTETEQGRTKEALARAEENYRLALEAVDRYFTRVSEDKLRYVPRMDRMRSDLLVMARDFYQRIANRDTGGTAALAELGVANLRLAYINAIVPVEPGPLQFGEHAREIFEKLVRIEPRSSAHLDHLAESLELLGECHRYGNQPSVAEPLLRRAVAIRERRMRESPGDGEMSSLAGALSGLGQAQGQSGRLEQARESLVRSRSLLNDLVNRAPENLTYQEALAYTLEGLTSLHGSDWPSTRIERYCEEALAKWKILVQKSPGETAYRVELAGSHGRLGQTYESAGHLMQAAHHYQEALAVWSSLQGDHPDLLREGGVESANLENLIDRVYSNANSLVRLALSHHNSDHATEAEEAYGLAMESYKHLIDARPGEASYQEELTTASDYLGQLYRATDRPDEAVVQHELGLAIAEDLARQTPRDNSRRFALGSRSNSLGLALLAAGHCERAETCFRRAMKDIELANPNQSSDSVMQCWVGGVASNLGLALGMRGEYRASLDSLGRAIETLRISTAKGISVAEDWLSEAYHRRAEILARIGRDREAIADCDASLSLGQGRSLEVTRDETRLLRGLGLAHSDKTIEALVVADGLSKANKLRGKDHLLLACIYSVVSRRASGAPKRSINGPGGPQSDYLARANDHLARAEQTGLFRRRAWRAKLRGIRDLEPLRESPIYRLILMDESFPADPFDW